MSRRHDRGREACYRAEEASGLYRTFGRFEDFSLAEAQALVNRVVSDPWVQKSFPRAKTFSKTGIRVIPGRTRGFAGHRGWDAVICLSPWARQEYLVLHEIAHHLAGANQGHNQRFCGTLMLLVARFIGRDQAETLRRSFGKGGVSCSWYGMPEVPRTKRPRYRTAERATSSAG